MKPNDNDHLEEMIENIPGGLAVYRIVEGRLHAVVINGYLRRLLGMDTSCDESPKQRDLIINRIHPADSEISSKWLTELFAFRSPQPLLFESRTDNGDRIWLSATGKAVRDPDGNVNAYVMYADATEQKRREEDFDTRINDMFYNNPDMICIARLDLTDNLIINGHSNLTEISIPPAGSPADDFFRGCLAMICKERDLAACAGAASSSSMLGLYSEGRRSLRFDFRKYDKATRSPRWATNYVALLQNPRNGHIEALIYTIDTNDAIINKRIIDRVTAVDYDYVALINTSTRTVRYFMMEGVEDESIPKEICNYDEDVLSSCTRLSTDKESRQYVELARFDTLVRELNSDPGGRYVFSLDFVQKDGSSKRKQYRFNWLDEDKDTIMFTRTDITQSYKVEVEHMYRLEAALKEAENANRAKTDFISRISHDIRTPINAIINMTSFAKEDADNKAKLLGDLSRIQTSTEFLMSLINDILDISKIDSGKIALKREPYHIDDFISSVQSMIEPLCSQKDIEFIVTRDTGSTRSVLTDRARLNQITFNLLSNSVKYTHAGGRISLRAGIEEPKDFISDCYITVQDNGIGMSDEFQKSMFDPFTQEHSNPGRTLTEAGTGLGLYIVKRIVDLFDGTVEVESSVGNGTTITVRFKAPVAEDDVLLKGHSSDIRCSMPADAKLSGRLIVAEDNRINMEITSRFLENYSLEFDKAANGREALDIFRRSPVGYYDGILMDIQMPVMDGYDATQAIRSLERSDAVTVPIIAMTADAFDESIRKSRRAGMNAYVTKPLNPDNLKSTLYFYLNK